MQPRCCIAGTVTRGSSRFIVMMKRMVLRLDFAVQVFACFLSLVSPICHAANGTAAQPQTAPYQKLRETTLNYNGPSEDFNNLKEIRVGWFGPDNTDDPLYGDLWWAACQAVKEDKGLALSEDASSIASLPIRLVPRWAADPWKSGVTLLTRMVFDEQPLALIGSVDSASTHLAEQVVAKANLPLLSPISTDKTATLAGVSWMFSYAPDSIVLARTLAGAILEELKRHDGRLVMLTTTDHESRMIARDLAHELSSHARVLDYRFDLKPGTSDFGEALRGTITAKPTAVIVIAGVDDAARMTKALREGLGSVTLFGSPSLSRTRFIELAGKDAEGVRVPLLFDPDLTDEATARFVARFSAERRHLPDYTAAMTYDATRLLIEAIRTAGPNRARIRDILARDRAWRGVAGSVHFDGTGQNNWANLRLGVIRDGKITPVPTP